MYVSFTPTKPGQRWFQLTATDSDQVQSTFGLTGVGVGPVLSITPGIIHTVNGSTEIGAVTGITRDNSGAVYTADYIQHVVFKIDGQGNSSVIAGELGVSGYDGDGGLAVNAHLNDPISLAFDSVGNLYIADVLNNAVRKIDVNGVITTVAGNGTAGYTGDGGAATGAELDNPLGVLADKSGNLYIGDTFNNVVRKVDVSGRITTVAGNGTGAGTGSWEGSDPEGGWFGDGGAATSAQLNGATGVALDGNGNLYIADTFNSAVRKVDGGGNITTVAGLCGDGCQQGYSGDGGPATEAMLDFPYGIATDAAGQLYIADTSNSAVRKVAADGTISTVAGNGLQAGPNARGKKWQGFVRKKNAHSRATDSNGDGGLATDANIFVPVQIAVDNNGNFYFTDVAMGNVRTVDVTTSLMDFGQVAPGSTSDSKTVTVTNAGNADLNFTQLSISDSFNWAGEGLCTTEAPLQAGANCLLSADFSPTEGGEYSGSIAITDDAFNSPHSVTLQGSAPTPDYTIAADPTTMTIHQGGTGTATLTVSAVDNYSGTITFGCSGLPAHSTCSFSPTSAVFDGGGDPVTVTLTVTTTGTGTTASLAVPRTGSGLPMDLWFVSTGLVGLVLAGAGRKRKMALRMLLALVVFAAIVGLNGCGSDSPTPHHNSNATPLGNYTTTVTTTATASGGGGAHSAPIAITVVQ